MHARRRRLSALVAGVLVLSPCAAGRTSALAGVTDRTTLNVLGPPLTALPSKLADPSWLVAWIAKPSLLRPGTGMPDFELTPGEAQAIAAYLYRSGAMGGEPDGRWQGGDARAGARLFVARGCRGCHATAPGDASPAAGAPNLAGIGLKARGAWLYAWIKAPRAYHPHTAMPRLVLSDDEVRHVVAYLLARREGGAALAHAPRFDPGADRTRGRELIERHECFKCHTIEGFAPLPPPFTPGADPTVEAALRDGRQLVAYYNCRGCHRLEGTGGFIAEHLERATLAPPTLEGEGARVQSSWLVDFLRRPRALRPWLEIRMPDYGFSEAEVKALVRYFAALAGVAAVDEAVPVVSEEVATRGLRRFAHFQCVQCHPTRPGATPPSGAGAEDLGIDLALAKTRLRPTWIREFLARPKAIAGAATRMPAVFYDGDGRPKVEQPHEDIAAVAAYLLHMNEPPEAALARLRAGRGSAGTEAPKDWTTYEY
jgi:mono/diheme cytochrome c family protein